MSSSSSINTSQTTSPNPEPFLKLVQQNKLEELRLFLEQYPELDINSISRVRTGDTGLHVAAQFGHLEIIKYFVEKAKVNLEVANSDGKTALHDAAHFGHIEVLEYLLANGASINSLKRADWTPLMLACTKSNLAVVKCLLTHGADLLFCNKDGWNCLHIAVREGNLEIIREILLHADKNDTKETLCKTPSKNGRTVLHTAVMHGHKETAEFLLSQNSSLLDVNSPDHCDHTSVMEACRFGYSDILTLLLDSYGGRLDLVNKNGMNCLHIASEAGQNEIIGILVRKYRMDIDSQAESSGLGPIHWAAKEDQVDTVELLIKLGANPGLKDKQNRTFLDLAKMLKRKNILGFYASNS